MDDIKRKKASFIWDPRRSGLFVLGLGGAVRLYAWDDRTKDVVAMGARDNIGPLAGLAWSGHPRDPLLAAAVAGGAIDLISFRRPLFARPGEMTTSETTTLHPPRQARQTTALAFSRSDHGYRNLLAQGFTKTRSDASVLIWDITRMDALTGASPGSSSSGLGVSEQEPSDGLSPDRPKPFSQLIPAETVNDLTWLSPSLLAVATQRQPIRLYDIRAPPTGGTVQPVLQFGSHASGLMTGNSGGSALQGSGTQTGAGLKVISLKLAADPFSRFRLASIDETPLALPTTTGGTATGLAQAYYSPSLREPRVSPSSAGYLLGGVVRIWDQRAPAHEVFSLAAANDGGLRSAAMSCEWDAEHEGRLGVLERAGDISVWDLCGPGSDVMGGGSALDEDRSLSLLSEPWRVSPPAPPAVYSSFVFPPRAVTGGGEETPSAIPRVVTFSAKAGGEVLWPKFHQRQRLAFASDNTLIICPRVNVIPPVAAPDRRLLAPRSRRHGKHPSFSSFENSSEDEDATPFGPTVPLPPTPTALLTTPTLPPTATSLGGPLTAGQALHAVPPRLMKAANVLAADPSVIFRHRAQMGYGVDPATNAGIADQLGDESLSFFWKWLQSWKTAFPSDHYSRYQFHLRGVQQILDGLESASFNPSLLQVRSRSPHTGNRSPSSSRDRSGQQLLSIADRRKQQSRARVDLRDQSPGSGRSGPAGLGSVGGDPADFKSACKRWIDNKASEGTIISISVAGGTKLTEERACALAVLDWALSREELEARIQSLERAGDYERAAFCGLFTGSVDRALEALEASGDEKYLTMVLLIRSRSGQSTRDAYAIASSRLISKLDSVEARAVCRFGLTGDWEEVLNEAGGSILDTLGLALRWAPDGILRQYLRSSLKNAVTSGDLMGLALTGLTDSKEAVSLLQAYIDKTGDIQTVALIATQFWPTKKVKARHERWIETYETLLQSWDMYIARARIEQARGRIAREQNVSFRPPKEIIVRCAFCNKNVADLRATASLSGVRGSSVTLCPGCHNGLPNCVICRLSIARAPADYLGETPNFDPEADLRPVYCLRCRHGGHRSPCLKEWFAKNEEDVEDEDEDGQVCAEVGCDCRCVD